MIIYINLCTCTYKFRNMDPFLDFLPCTFSDFFFILQVILQIDNIDWPPFCNNSDDDYPSTCSIKMIIQARSLIYCMRYTYVANADQRILDCTIDRWPQIPGLWISLYFTGFLLRMWKYSRCEGGWGWRIR